MQEGDLRRQVHFLRVQLAHAREEAASNYKATAMAAVVLAVCLWALLSIALEGGNESAVNWLCGAVVAVFIVFWWTVNRYHEARERDLADVIAATREAGYSVEIMRGGIHFAEMKVATAPKPEELKDA